MTGRVAVAVIAALVIGLVPAAPAMAPVAAEATDKCGNTAKQRKLLKKRMNIASASQKRKIMRHCKHRKKVFIRGRWGPNPHFAASGADTSKIVGEWVHGCDHPLETDEWWGKGIFGQSLFDVAIRTDVCWKSKTAPRRPSGWKGRIKKGPSIDFDGDIAGGLPSLSWDWEGVIGSSGNQWSNCGGGWHSCWKIRKEVKLRNCVLRIGCIQHVSPTFTGGAIAYDITEPGAFGKIGCRGEWVGGAGGYKKCDI